MIEVERKIIEALRTDVLSATELAEIVDRSPSRIRDILSKLERYGCVNRHSVCANPRGGVIQYWAVGKVAEVKKPKQARHDGAPVVKRKTVSINEVPFVKWWEGGGLYAG